MARPPSKRRTWILRAAAKLFSRHGLQDVKLDQVAKEAGVAKGTIYLYFPNKQALFCECLLDGHEEFLEQAATTIANQMSPLSVLRDLIEMQAAYVAQKGSLIQQMIQLGPSQTLHTGLIERVASSRRQFIDVLSRLFVSGRDQGTFTTSLSPRQMAIAFIQVFDLNLKFRVFGEPSLTTDEVYDMLLRLFNADCE